MTKTIKRRDIDRWDEVACRMYTRNGNRVQMTSWMRSRPNMSSSRVGRPCVSRFLDLVNLVINLVLKDVNPFRKLIQLEHQCFFRHASRPFPPTVLYLSNKLYCRAL